MKQGAVANAAVEETVKHIESMRLNHSTHMSRAVFCFPRVKNRDGEWMDGAPYVAGAAIVARDPDKRVNKEVPLKYYNEGHSIPSVIIPLEGIQDVEYKVSRNNMESLLSVGCIVFQRYRKGFGVRIPFGHPLLTGQPFEITVEPES